MRSWMAPHFPLVIPELFPIGRYTFAPKTHAYYNSALEFIGQFSCFMRWERRWEGKGIWLP